MDYLCFLKSFIFWDSLEKTDKEGQEDSSLNLTQIWQYEYY